MRMNIAYELHLKQLTLDFKIETQIQLQVSSGYWNSDLSQRRQ